MSNQLHDRTIAQRLAHDKLELQRRAEKAEARVAELEEDQMGMDSLLHSKVWNRKRAEARVAELEAKIKAYKALAELDAAMQAPPGHVAVMLPKEDVEEHARYSSGVAIEERFRKACRKALEADDE